MAKSYSTIMLDPNEFDHTMRRWSIPVLGLPQLSCCKLYVDGDIIPSHSYRVEKEFLNLSPDVKIYPNSRICLNLEQNTHKFRYWDWVSRIAAIMGIIGTIIQPIGFEMDYIYFRDSDEIKVKHYWYDTERNAAGIEFDIENLTQSFQNFSRVYVAAHLYDKSKGYEYYNLQHLSSPINPDRSMEIEIKTSGNFTNDIRKRCARGEDAYIHIIAFATDPSSEISAPFTLASLPSGGYELLAKRAIQPSDIC